MPHRPGWGEAWRVERCWTERGVRGMFQTPLLELEWEYWVVPKHPLIFRTNVRAHRPARQAVLAKRVFAAFCPLILNKNKSILKT